MITHRPSLRNCSDISSDPIELVELRDLIVKIIVLLSTGLALKAELVSAIEQCCENGRISSFCNSSCERLYVFCPTLEKKTLNSSAFSPRLSMVYVFGLRF